MIGEIFYIVWKRWRNEETGVEETNKAIEGKIFDKAYYTRFYFPKPA